MSKSKSTKKYLLVALTTTREDSEGEQKRVRFAAGSVVTLTADEMEQLDGLEKATGKLHYRDPKNESVADSEPEVVDLDDFLGQSVAIDKKNVEQLKAYLTFHDQTFEDSASKADLTKLVKAHADPDAGL